MKDQPLSWYTTKGEDAGKVQTVDEPKEPRGYTPFVSEAIRACADMGEPPINNAHSLRALKTVFAIYTSADTGRTTKIQ
jgi:predicted dehydrogenase